MADTSLTLDEYGEAEIELDHSQAQRLRALAKDRLALQLGDSPGSWRVKASSYVGTVVLPGLKILIKPKISTANLFYLLEADSRPLDVGDELFDYERTSDLMPAFATFYARHLEIALSRGITREYREHAERLASLRGRVDLPAQQRSAGLPLPLECRFDEYTADIQLNRILLGATSRLMVLPGVTPHTRRALRQLASRLGEAAPPTAADMRSETNFTRLNEHCRPAEHLARMVMRDVSLLDSSGTTGAAVFLVDMNQVFEAFIESRLRRHLIDRLVVTGQWRDRLDIAGHVRIKPDLVFGFTKQTPIYVGDTKYKVTSDGIARQADYYQMLAYSTALGVPEGILVYCQHDGTVPPREIEVRNVGTRLRTWAVRLDRTPHHVEEEMLRLADHIAFRARAAQPTVSQSEMMPV